MACVVPITGAVIGVSLTKPQPKHLPAALMGMLLCLPSLLLLQRINLHAGWWTFPPHDGLTLLCMPVELWLGWTVLWGAMPTLARQRLSFAVTALLLFLLDIVAMPLMTRTLHLHHTWLAGELLACACILLPSLVLQRFTLQQGHVNVRATLQVIAAAGVFLYLPAEILIATQHPQGWQTYWQWPAAIRTILVQCGLLFALPGLSAVQDFATVGRGTPLPFDPPQRLVTTGMYRYVANPIQLSCLLVMLLWAFLLRSPWLLAGPCLCVAYAAGIAQWDEAVDLRDRFGSPWTSYRRSVHAWLPRLRPFAEPAATVYIARDCGPCSAVRCFLQSRGPVALNIVHAELLSAGSITRMRYVCGEETAEGVRAIARALEHLHLGWACVGALLRLPGIAHIAQLLMDASGFGPMVRTSSQCSLPQSPQ